MEFKRDELKPEGLAKEIVAFSNFQGGVVLLGVEDDGSISGVTRPKLEEWVMTVCRDKIRPEIIPYFETIKEQISNLSYFKSVFGKNSSLSSKDNRMLYKKVS